MKEIKVLRKWIKRASKYYSREEIKEILLKKGWKEEEIEKASKKKFPLFLFFVLFIFFVCFLLVYSLLFLPPREMEMPARLEENASIEEMIIYSARMLGADSLHAIPLTKNYPVIEFSIENESYFIVVEEGKIILKNATNPDIRIRTTRQILAKLATSENLIEALKEEIEKGSIIVDIAADEATLLAKGYLSLYKKIAGK